MTNADFRRDSYRMATYDSPDMLLVRKVSESDWLHIEMTTNEEANGAITLRSQQHAEMLYAMLGQVLGK